jgi:hypothetical protein
MVEAVKGLLAALPLRKDREESREKVQLKVKEIQSENLGRLRRERQIHKSNKLTSIMLSPNG